MKSNLCPVVMHIALLGSLISEFSVQAQHLETSSASNSASSINIQISTATLTEEEAKPLFLEWTLGKAGLGPIYFFNRPSGRPVGSPGQVTGILTLPQYRATVDHFEKIGRYNSFGSKVLTNKIEGQVGIDHGQFLEVTASTVDNGQVVYMQLTAFLRDKAAENKGALHRVTHIAFVYSGQAVVLAETTGTDKDPYLPTNGRVKFILIKAETTPKGTRPAPQIPAQMQLQQSSVPTQIPHRQS